MPLIIKPFQFAFLTLSFKRCMRENSVSDLIAYEENPFKCGHFFEAVNNVNIYYTFTLLNMQILLILTITLYEIDTVLRPILQ